MTHILICLVFYAALVFLDIIPSIRNEQWKVLKISITILLITLAVNIAYGIDMKLPSLNQFIQRAIRAMLRV